MNTTYVYKIQAGENLADIAFKFTGNSNRWSELTAINPNVRNVVPGRYVISDQRIIIPANWIMNKNGIGLDNANNLGVSGIGVGDLYDRTQQLMNTAGFVYYVFTKNGYDKQYQGIKKYIQDRYNVKRGYKGLSTKTLKFDYDLIFGQISQNIQFIPGLAFSVGAALLYLNANTNVVDSFFNDISGTTYLGHFKACRQTGDLAWYTCPSEKDAIMSGAVSDKLNNSNSLSISDVINLYEYRDQLTSTDQGGENPFSVRILPFVIFLASEGDERPGLFASIDNVLSRRINSLNTTMDILLGLIDKQVARDVIRGSNLSANSNQFKNIGPVLKRNAFSGVGGIGVGDLPQNNPGQPPWELYSSTLQHSAIHNWLYDIKAQLDPKAGFGQLANYFCDANSQTAYPDYMSCYSDAYNWLSSQFDKTISTGSDDQSRYIFASNWDNLQDKDIISIVDFIKGNFISYITDKTNQQKAAEQQDTINKLWNSYCNAAAASGTASNASAGVLKDILKAYYPDKSYEQIDKFLGDTWPNQNVGGYFMVAEAYKNSNVTISNTNGVINYGKACTDGKDIVLGYVQSKFNTWNANQQKYIIGIQPIIPLQPVQECDLEDNGECAKFGQIFSKDVCGCIPKPAQPIQECDLEDNGECAKFGQIFSKDVCGCVPRPTTCTGTCAKNQVWNDKTCQCVDLPKAIENPTPEQCADAIIQTLKLVGKYDEQVAKYGSETALYNFALDSCKKSIAQNCKLTKADCQQQGKDFDANKCACIATGPGGQNPAEKTYTWLYILGGLTVLAVGGGIGYYYYSKSNKQKSSVSTGELAAGEPVLREFEGSDEIVKWMRENAKDYLTAKELADVVMIKFNVPIDRYDLVLSFAKYAKKLYKVR